MNCPHVYENGDLIQFKIDYEKETVKFNGSVFGSNTMYLKEFANKVLKVRAESKEFLAVYIGKEVIDSYHKNNNYYNLNLIKSKKNIFIGTIQKV